MMPATTRSRIPSTLKRTAAARPVLRASRRATKGAATPMAMSPRPAGNTGRAAAVRFNVLGILDLVVAGVIGFLLLGTVEATPSTAPLTLLPLALILTAAVPLAVALHIVSLRRLLTAAKPEDDHAAHVSAAS